MSYETMAGMGLYHLQVKLYRMQEKYSILFLLYLKKLRGLVILNKRNHIICKYHNAIKKGVFNKKNIHK